MCGALLFRHDNWLNFNLSVHYGDLRYETLINHFFRSDEEKQNFKVRYGETMQEYIFPSGLLHINDVLVDIETQLKSLFLFCTFFHFP